MVIDGFDGFFNDSESIDGDGGDRFKIKIHGNGCESDGCDKWFGFFVTVVG